MAAKTPSFKPYYQHQIMAFPPTLEELVNKSHPVRIVSDMIDKINIQPLLASYHLRGTSSYHPAMLLKVLVFGYVSNIYSSRKLETACKENVNFMWLSGMSYPDHNTINRFRSERLKKTLRQVFEQIVLLLADEGLLSIEDVFTDGTKIEANANKYTFVWKRAIHSNKEKMKKSLTEIWRYAQKVAKSEDDLPEPPDFTTIDSQKVQQAVDTLNASLAKRPDIDKKVKAKLHYVTKHYPKKIKEYEQKEAILGNRNSYSKTDPDATFMRMKDDHMRNGQLKAGYNIQISTSNQYVVNYSIHPNPTDTTTLASHIQAHEDGFGKTLKTLTADAGYGSEQNYDILEQKSIEAYVKFGLFDKQQNKNHNLKHPFSVDKLHYNQAQDCYICPMGQPMNYIGTVIKKTATGYIQKIKKYQAQQCTNCPMRGLCHQSKTNRIIQVNEDLNRYKEQAHALLNSEKGIAKRRQRCHDVETVFGNIKHNYGFRRFMLRGKEKVAIEWGLLAIAQNLRKKAA